MRMAWDQLKNLLVVSQSGNTLGHVVGFVFDPETHAIVQYEVRYGPPLVRRVLLIAVSQVVSITAERMTVDDAVVRQAKVAQPQSPAAEPTLTGLASIRKD